MKLAYQKVFHFTFKKYPVRLLVESVIDSDLKGIKYLKFCKKIERALSRIMDK